MGSDVDGKKEREEGMMMSEEIVKSFGIRGTK